MTHNSTATTPHNSDTNHNDQHLQSMTPESRVKDLGGIVVHYKFYTVGKFTDSVAAEYFYNYMQTKSNYEVNNFTGNCIMYRHKSIKHTVS